MQENMDIKKLSGNMEKRKAAIFTWCLQKTLNYGQILQCYALQKMCQAQGLDTVVVKYRGLQQDESAADMPVKGNGRNRYELLYRNRNFESQASIQAEKFMDFIDRNIHLSQQCYSEQDILEEVRDKELLILGSDQLWNPLWFDSITLFNFAQPKQRCFTYATGGIISDKGCFNDTIKLIAGNLMNFDFVSVREPISRQILQKYTQQPIEVVLDPTLMLSAEEWNKVSSDYLCYERYIVCYFLGLLSPHKHIVKEIAKRHHVKTVIYIKMKRFEEQINDEGIFKCIDNAGPAEFLSLVKNAEAVCTDSFHGMAFSIIYDRDFYIMDRAYVSENIASNNRMENILKKFEIGNRFVHSKKDVSEVSEIDIEQMHRKHEYWKNVSREYFIKAIGGEIRS